MIFVGRARLLRLYHGESFTRALHRYRITRLVYFEEFADVRDAIAREKHIKAWTRSRRITLVEGRNPSWLDLAEPWFPMPRLTP